MATRGFDRLLAAVLFAPVLAALLLAPNAAAAQRATNAAQATVYVRLYGSVHGEVRDRGIKTGTVDSDNQLVGNGSGFLISEHGYVLTNNHVVADHDLNMPAGPDELVRIIAQVKITRIEVCPSSVSQPQRGFRNPCVEASVYFADAVADLAVLYIGGSGRPYLAMGDSDAIETGEPVQVLGYPFGVKLEIGREITIFSDTPAMSVVSGSIAGIRQGESDRDRYLQIDANVNPGNSGGPVVNRDGYVVGVIQSKLLDANGVGFAVPVNRVKDFLESHLLDPLLPSRRLRPGPLQTLEAKGLALPLPEGMVDSSPFRARVESQSLATGITLRIDRILSPWSSQEVADNLMAGRLFEPVAFPNGATARQDGAHLSGHASGLTGDKDDKKEVGMYFAILNLGLEALVARFVGPAEQIAFNASVLRDSLQSLQGRALIGGRWPPTVDLLWAVPESAPSAPPLPEGWIVEPRGPSCVVGSPTIVAQAAPAQHFDATLRVAILDGSGLTPAQAASACSAVRGALGPPSYLVRPNWFGLTHVIEGVFIAVGPRRIVQIEAVASIGKDDYLRSLLAPWAEHLARYYAPR